MRPIIVTGPPHSGTSVVARLLQTRLGVMMDEGPLRCDEHKPFGYYEDRQIIDINRLACDYLMARVGTGAEQVPLQWATSFAAWLAYRNDKYDQWGWKDPTSVALAKHMHQFFAGPVWIVCTRTDEQIIKGQMEKEGFPEAVAVQGLKAYKDLIQRELDGQCHYLDLSEYRAENDLVSELEAIIWQ